MATGSGDFPAAGLSWVSEVEWSHGDRVTSLLRAKDIPVATVTHFLKKRSNVLVFTSCNIISERIIPTECFKHIMRIFHVPFTCSDLERMHSNSLLQKLVQERSVFKIQTSPKNLEHYVAELLIGDSDEDGAPRPCKVPPKQIHPSKCTHIIQVVYSAHESLFRWGIVSLSDAQGVECMTSVALERTVLDRVIAGGILPASRAYFKMQEIFEVYFPKWGWGKEFTSCSNEKGEINRWARAVDVGASPGGWTQYLSTFCHSVLAIDPGSVIKEVTDLPNVKYVPHLVEAEETKLALEAFSTQLDDESCLQSDMSCLKVNICVCDVNVEPHIAAELLVDKVLPYMSNGSREVTGGGHGAASRYDHAAYVILTLKLPRNPSQKRIESSYRIACNILSLNESDTAARGKTRLDSIQEGAIYRCCDFKMIHLNANSRNERTLLCRYDRCDTIAKI